MAVKIGTAWVQIKPSLDGVQHSINKQLQGTGTSASKNIGKEIGKDAAIGAAVGTAVMNGVIAISSKVANAVGDMFRGAVDEMDAVVRSSNAMAQMGYDTGEVAEKIEQLRNNANKTAATMGDLTDGFLNLTASWKDMDLTADATQALSDAILSFGGTPDMVANAITQISQTDLDGPLDAQTWLSLRNSGLIPALGTLARMNNMSLGDFKKALGQGQLSTRDLVEGLIELDKVGTDTQESFESIARSNAAATWSGSWDTAKNTVTSAISQQLTKLWELNGGGQAIVDMGDRVAETVGVISTKIQEFITWLNSGSVAAESFKVALGGIAGLAGAGALQGVGTMISKLVGPLLTLAASHPIIAAVAAAIGGLVAFFTQTDLGKGMMADFITWINETAIPTLKDFGETIKEKLTAFAGSDLGKKLQGLVTSIGKLFNALGKLFAIIIKISIEAVQPLWAIIKGVFEFLQPVFAWIADVVFSVLGFIIDLITEIISVASGVISFISDGIDGVATYLSAAWETIKGVFGVVGQWFKDTFGGAWQGIKDAFAGAGEWFNGVWENIKEAFSKAWELGQDIVEGLVKGITDAGQWVKDKISGFCEGALDAIKDFFGIHSPSRVMMEIGGYLDKGLVKGIEKEASSVSNAMEDVGKEALGAMSGLDSDFAVGVNRSLDVAVRQDDLAARGTVIQNNNITISDDFDLKLAQSKLAYAVSQA